MAINETRIAIESEGAVVAARRTGREMARQLGFSSADQTRLATAISELTRNVIQYAGRCRCRITEESDQSMICIRVVVEDHGPGIPNVDMAMSVRFSTIGGLGAGLPGTRRLMQEFHNESRPGHTKVAIALARRRP